MKSKDSGIHLRIHQNPTSVDLLHHPEKDLFFMTPKRPIHYELGSETFSKLVTFYAQRDRLRVTSAGASARQAIEDETDRLFFTPWPDEVGARSAWIAEKLIEVNTALA